MFPSILKDTEFCGWRSRLAGQPCLVAFRATEPTHQEINTGVALAYINRQPYSNILVRFENNASDTGRCKRGNIRVRRECPFSNMTVHLGPQAMPSYGNATTYNSATIIEGSPRCLTRDLDAYPLRRWANSGNMMNLIRGNSAVKKF
ncbi:hypothetical protein CDEST_01013 [Colletotrichum destructivum]|uniref:Uncharacterized protein n=1 Tax=Colletotrichum destructivum TaxID=34406 RepID=A0AAX4HZ49_9PEZI|nr:hypothetical protein CDEST_01013 [Colletotrichum destructivum]